MFTKVGITSDSSFQPAEHKTGAYGELHHDIKLSSLTFVISEWREINSWSLATFEEALSKHRVTTTAHPSSQLAFPAILRKGIVQLVGTVLQWTYTQLDKTILPFPSSPMFQSSPHVNCSKYDITPEHLLSSLVQYPQEQTKLAHGDPQKLVYRRSYSTFHVTSHHLQQGWMVKDNTSQNGTF